MSSRTCPSILSYWPLSPTGEDNRQNHCFPRKEHYRHHHHCCDQRQSDKRVHYYIVDGDLPGQEFSIGSRGDLTLRYSSLTSSSMVNTSKYLFSGKFFVPRNNSSIFSGRHWTLRPKRGFLSGQIWILNWEFGHIIVLKKLKHYRFWKYCIRVVATDGRQNDTTRVNITVININDWDPR